MENKKENIEKGKENMDKNEQIPQVLNNAKKNAVKVTTKLYPLPDKNSKGYYIGDYRIQIDSKQLPFSSFDQVDLLLNNLFKTMKNESLDDEDPKKVANNDVIAVFEKEHIFEPIRAKGGQYKIRGKKSRGKLSKNRKTKKNKK